ncbi:MAG: nucleoside-diphosphate kinase [Verrucomicrobia bacterium]|nr:nucleoside-diphosphate kinase [Verrucomicrobiota bacterium]MBS0635905.1 nucleoside-diphosphate kinase [Verrucomicrobiota bacterium]
MKLERTLSIIKPDAVANNHIGGIISMLEKAGLQVIAAKMVHMTQEDAEGFYAVHKERGFFRELVDFMTSGPSLVMVLEGEHAVKKNRDVMGATDPKKAEKGTIRATFATSIDANAVHGSDSLENAEKEIQFFFTQHNICERKKHHHQHQGCGCSHHH